MKKKYQSERDIFIHKYGWSHHNAEVWFAQCMKEIDQELSFRLSKMKL